MALFDLPLEVITEQNVQALLDRDPADPLEGKLLDFKAQLLLNTRDEKKEFLSDISSFANASGGDLLIGVNKVDGKYEMLGIERLDLDNFKQQIENLMRDSLEPRLIPIPDMRLLQLENGCHLLIIRTNRSWMGPHRVGFGHWQFYSRNNSGKYPLSIDEIRSAFTTSQTLLDRIRNFRAERIGNLLAGETPVSLVNFPKFVLHSIPLTAFSGAQHLHLPPLVDASGEHLDISPLGCSGSSRRLNFDGLLSYDKYPDETDHNGYMQIFRNGVIETVNASLMDFENDIASIAYEREFIRALPNILGIQRALGVQPPVFLMVSLVGVKGSKMLVAKSFSHGIHQIEKDVLNLPEIELDTLDIQEPHTTLRPIFDIIWQACGVAKSPNYDNKGQWRPK